MNHTSLTEDIKLLINREVEKIKELKREGRLTAGLLNPLFPFALIAGCGIRPFRLALGATASAETEAEKYIRPDSCPFCKAVIGNFSLNSPLHSLVDIVIAVNSCDQIRRSGEILSNTLNKDVLQIQYPITYTNASKEYFLSELKFIIKALEKRSKQTFNPEEALHYYNEQAKASNTMRKLYFSCNVSPMVLHYLSILYTIANPHDFNNYLSKMKPSLPKANATKRVLVIGSPILFEDDYIIDCCEQHNTYPLLLNSTGLKLFLNKKSLLENHDNIANKLGSDLIDSMPHIGMRPNNMVLNQIKEIASTINAQGIIVKTLSFCDLWYTEKVRLKQVFDIPVMVVDTGYGHGGNNRIETRTETFLETL